MLSQTYANFDIPEAVLETVAPGRREPRHAALERVPRSRWATRFAPRAYTEQGFGRPLQSRAPSHEAHSREGARPCERRDAARPRRRVCACRSPLPPKLVTPRNLSANGADAVIPSVATDAKGNTVVAWAQARGSDWTIQAVYRPAGGSWGLPRGLSMPANHVASPQVAIAGTNVVAVWERFDGKNLIAQTADRDPKTGTWGIPTSLSAGGRDAQAPRIAIDARGDTAAVWASVGLQGWTIQAAYRPGGGSWLPTAVLDAPQVGTGCARRRRRQRRRRDRRLDGDDGQRLARVRLLPAGRRQLDEGGLPLGCRSERIACAAARPRALRATCTAVWSRSVGAIIVPELSTRSAATGAWSASAAASSRRGRSRLRLRSRRTGAATA